MIFKNINNLHSCLNTDYKENITKKIELLLNTIINVYYANQFLFFNISLKNLSYKEIYEFLKLHSTEGFQYELSESNLDILLGFSMFLKHRFSFSDRFEFCLCFYDDTEENFSITCLLCFKFFGFDSVSDIKLYIDWLFKSLLKYLYVSDVLTFSDIQVFYKKNIFTKEYIYIYNNSIYNNNNSLFFNISYMYVLLSKYLCFLGLESCLLPLYYVKHSYYPISLDSINNRTPLSIINLISIYLVQQNCFLDLNTLMIYKKVEGSNSTVFYLCSLLDLKIKFPSILLFLKNVKHEEFVYNHFYRNPGYPVFSFFFTVKDYDLLDTAFSILIKKPILLHPVKMLSFNIIEYQNGFYSITDNCFYSFSYLTKFYPENNIKCEQIISVNYLKKKFFKKDFLSHEFMLFLVKRFSKPEFLSVFNLFFYKNLCLVPVQNFEFHIVVLSQKNKIILFNFLKSMYNNYPFIFVNYQSLKCYMKIESFRFIDILPLFIFETFIDYSLLEELNIFISSKNIKPITIFLVIDLSLSDSDKFRLNSNLFLNINFLDLNQSLYDKFFSLLEKYNYHFDLFVVMNMYFHRLSKHITQKKFISNFKLKSGTSPYDEVSGF